MHKKHYFTSLVFLIATSLFASNILDTYRVNGINNIEKEMDFALTKKQYWNNYLENRDTTFGYTERYSSILTCDKKNSKLKLYQLNKKSVFTLKEDYSALTGKIEGTKIKEGDLKTPVGIYNLVQKIPNPDSFYGPLAFVTSYPNDYDKIQGRDGHGIWIHGYPIKESRDSFTKGCIAIKNNNLECLDKNIDTNKTLLIINKQDVKQNISKKILSQILSDLYKWRYAWLYSDIDTYLHFYSKDFIRYDGMTYHDFKQYKKRIFSKTGKKTIIFTNISIFPYPNSKDIYQITFNEKYSSPSFKFEGEKSLMIKIKNNKLQIFTER